jgi:phosphoglycolate phosphatase-like HAD superfamily hydrolase
MGNVLIFDFDGVIADSFGVLFRNFIDACKKNGFYKIDSREKFLRLFEKNFYESFMEFGVKRQDISKILGDLNLNLLKEKNKPILFPGVKGMLKNLSKKIRLLLSHQM